MSDTPACLSHPWAERPIGEIANVIVGGTPSTSVDKYWNGEVPWMASGDVHLRQITDVPKRITQLGLRHSNATLVAPPTVAVALAGQGKTRGTVALVLCELCTNQSVALLAARNKSLDVRYLFYNLAFRYEELRSRSAGGGRAGLSKQLIEQIPLPLPSPTEQSTIVDVLTRVDQAIEQTEALIEKQQRIKTGLMQDLLTRGIDDQGTLRSEKTHKFKDSPLGGIPVEWDIKSCEQLCHEIVVGIVIRPAQYYRPDGVPVLRSANVRDGWISGDELVFMSGRDNEALRKSQLRAGDLVTVRTGYPGTTAVVPPELDGCNCVDIVISRPKRDLVRSEFLSLWVNSYHGKRQVLEGQGGLAQQHFNVGEMRKLLVKVPKPHEQQRIEATLQAHRAFRHATQRSLAKLQSMRVALMHDLLSGHRRVTALLSERLEAIA